MGWVQVGTLLIALYGAGVSTYTLIASRREKKRRIKVAFRKGFFAGASGLSDEMLFITVTNPGERTVGIMQPAILLPDNRTLFFPAPKSDAQFPHELHEGRRCQIWEPMEAVRTELRRMGFTGSVDLVPFVDNAVGDRYSGKKWRLPIPKSTGT